MSTPLFKKLNFKVQSEILILNAPDSFTGEERAIDAFTIVKTKLDQVKEIDFVLAFVKHQADIELLAPIINQKLQGDGLVWFAYPKKSSKKYESDITRDQGWQTLGDLGFEGVRQVAIDQDWSALRFRKVDYIKTMTRSKDFAMSKKGKQKTKNGNNS